MPKKNINKPEKNQIDAIKEVYPSIGLSVIEYLMIIYVIYIKEDNKIRQPEQNTKIRGKLLKDVIAFIKWPNLFEKV